MRKITHIVFHTAAGAHFGNDGKFEYVTDDSADSMRRYHTKVKGWNDIGYNAVCRLNGSIEPGRPEEEIPAGVLGFNEHTLHICCSGHGDYEDFTDAQKKSLAKWIADKAKEYGIADEILRNPSRVLGHRECYALQGVPNTRKTCPGKKVNCREIRLMVLEALR